MALRKLFETYANIRPVCELPGMTAADGGRAIDLAAVRKNVEDLYAVIEYMPTSGAAESLKLISRTGCEKIAPRGSSSRAPRAVTGSTARPSLTP